jgi:hypothetical protein
MGTNKYTNNAFINNLNGRLCLKIIQTIVPKIKRYIKLSRIYRIGLFLPRRCGIKSYLKKAVVPYPR